MQSMKPDGMKKVEGIIKKNLSRIIKIHYKVNTEDYTSPGYIIPCSVNHPKRKLVNSDNSYIKICNTLDSKRIPPELSNKGMPPKRVPISKIHIKDIYWIEVLDHPVFYESKSLSLSNIVEVCLKNNFNKPDITGLFTFDDKENIEKSLEKIKKITKSKYPSFKFDYTNNLVVLGNIGKNN